MSVATRPRVTIAMCCRGSSIPASISVATQSESRRLVSETLWGANQRDVLKIPSGAS